MSAEKDAFYQKGFDNIASSNTGTGRFMYGFGFEHEKGCTAAPAQMCNCLLDPVTMKPKSTPVVVDAPRKICDRGLCDIKITTNQRSQDEAKDGSGKAVSGVQMS